MNVEITVLLFAFSGALALAGDTTTKPAALTPQEIQKIRFEQKLEQQISLDLLFVNDKGHEVKLEGYFENKPVILVLGYYECPMLCGLVLNGVLEALKEMKGSAGKDFAVVCVSINPSEQPRLAAAKKASYMRQYLRPGAEDGWHFLTGKKDAIAKLTEQVGFQFAYDPVSRQYAHPSGIVVLTPTGKVSRYFFGVNYASKQLETAIKDASWNRIGGKVQEFLFLCLHYTPFKGRYGKEIMLGVRIFGLTTLGALAGVIWWSLRTSPQSRSAVWETEAECQALPR